jgi:hypothetical protein
MSNSDVSKINKCLFKMQWKYVIHDKRKCMRISNILYPLIDDYNIMPRPRIILSVVSALNLRYMFTTVHSVFIINHNHLFSKLEEYILPRLLRTPLLRDTLLTYPHPVNVRLNVTSRLSEYYSPLTYDYLLIVYPRK